MPIKNYFDLLKNGKDLNKEGRTFRSIKVESTINRMIIWSELFLILLFFISSYLDEKPYELSVENYSSIENAIEITGLVSFFPLFRSEKIAQ